MAVTHFSGPLEIGEGATVARPVEVITLPLAVTAVANTDFVLALPACRIVEIRQRTAVAFTGTTVTLQAGLTAGAADVIAAADIKAVATRQQTLVGAASGALAAFGPGNLHFRIVQTGPTAVGGGEVYVAFVRLGAG
jgi:hypothetical protein